MRWPKDDFSCSKVEESVKIMNSTAGSVQKLQMKPISKTITFIADVVQKSPIIKIINFSADVRQKTRPASLENEYRCRRSEKKTHLPTELPEAGAL